MSVNANILTWNDDQRRLSSYVVLGAAAAMALVAVAMWWFLEATPAWVYWALVVLLALVLAFMAALLFAPVRAAAPAAQPAAEPAYAAPAAAAPAAEAYAPAAPAFEPRVLTLRCGDCGTIFEVTDTGERPLYHTCPGCGAEGALRDEPAVSAPAGAEAAAAEPMYAPEPAYAPTPAVEAEPAAPVAPPVKKMKLRCGGCKEVFSIEDTGERPLRRPCPYCARVGEVK